MRPWLACVVSLLLAACTARPPVKLHRLDAGEELEDAAPAADLPPAPDLPPLPDAAVDVAEDAAVDAAPDVAAAVAPDAAEDVAPDVGPDLAPDLAPDLPPDVAPDTAPDPATLACAAPALTVLPVALADVAGIVPLGNLAPAAHTLPAPQNTVVLGNTTATPKVITVRWPSGGRLTKVVRTDAVTPEYGLFVTVCKDLFVYFDHLTNLDAGLLAQIGEFPPAGCSAGSCTKTVALAVSAGDPIAQLSVPGNGQKSFDLGARDARLAAPVGYANLDRYFQSSDKNDLRHVACPWESFATSTRDDALTLMGDPFNAPPIRRIAEPRCGTVVQDLAGTAQGNWFADPAPAMPATAPPDEARTVALVHDAMYAGKNLLSVGNVSTVGAGRYYFLAQSSGHVNRAFSDIAPGSGVYCYENLTEQNGTAKTGIVLLELTADNKLNLERGHFSLCGPGPWTFTISMATFVR